MPLTPTYSLPYPLSTDPPDVPTDMGELATAVENTIVTQVNSLSGRITAFENPARCRVALSGTFSQGTTDVGAASGWAAVSGEDPLGMFSFTGGRSQIAIPPGYGGRYKIGLEVYFDNGSGFAVAGITKNTTALTSGFIARYNATSNGGDRSRCQGDKEVVLVAGDVLRWVTYASVACNCGGSIFGLPGAEVFIRRVALN